MNVTIITPAYNRAFTIIDTIRSINNQEYANIQHIIVDGASSDNTLEVVKNHKIENTIIISESDDGIYDAINKGIKLASGDIIGVLNSDDFYLNERVILEIVNEFEQHATTDMVLGNVDFVRPENLTRSIRRYSSFKFAPWKMRFGFMPAHPATFVKKSAYDAVGLYNTDYVIGADFEWFVRAFFKHRLSYRKIDKYLVRMRTGGVSSSG